MRHTLLYFLESTVGRIPFMNKTVQLFYSTLLVPIVVKWLQLKHSNLIHVEIRHSLNEGRGFRAFSSDIDSTLVFKNGSDPSPLIADFFNIRKCLIMFDLPEVYDESEFNELMKLKKSKHWNLVKTCWNIRKINWNNAVLQTQCSEYEKNKKHISNLKAARFLFRGPQQTTVQLKDIRSYEWPFSVSTGEKTILYFSQYLETGKTHALNIELSANEFKFFNSIMPGEKIIDEATPSMKEAKKVLHTHELFLTRNSIRLMKVQKLDTAEKVFWTRHLENLGLE